MLGARIAALRRDAGWSQAELGKRLRVSASAVGMYEQGRREPSVQLLSNMASLFGVSIDFLVTGKATTAREQEELNQLLLQRTELADLQQDGRRVRPFSREELAAFLCVNRSALSHELSVMQQEGLITFRKNIFTLRSV